MPPCRMCGARWDVRTVETSPRTAGTGDAGTRPSSHAGHGHTNTWTRGPPIFPGS